MTWFYSFFNASKYLVPARDKNVENQQLQTLNQQSIQASGAPEGQEQNQNAFAVIYGVSNKAGMAFAYYLMSKGFNLILIERDNESIKNLVIKLHQLLPDSKSVII